ncbi:MHYT domain-containing protein [Cupriavidus necator]|uniref:MHYT domain-containing protein n=1 Tax=Cupriavidus necator TaxID=106590 RepID=UPI002787393E|nr:MHYT domain-containing protein [Cupriavidus necator]MDQ0139695.1 NO-binding membrane sensor protein with MHYT domain [Cupriavidus necator]
MFVGFEPVAGALVPFAYDWPMVGLSFLISVCGAYVGLRWSRRVRQPDGRLDVDRLLCASVALGGGAVWSMHFIGMVAYQTPTHREFGLFTTLASLLVVMVLAGAGLALASRPRGSRTSNVVQGGVLTGLGVVAMHYTGMAAIRSNTRFDWDIAIIALSVVIAVVVSVVALWLAVTVKTGGKQLAAAVVMGVAVCGMHYTGMSAGTMICTSPTYAPSLFAIEGDSIGYAVFGLSLITLLVILVVEATRTGAVAGPAAMARTRDPA